MKFDMTSSGDEMVTVDQLTALVTQLKAERAESGFTDAELITNAFKSLDPEGTDFISLDLLRGLLMGTGEKLPEADVCTQTKQYYKYCALNILSRRLTHSSKMLILLGSDKWIFQPS